MRDLLKRAARRAARSLASYADGAAGVPQPTTHVHETTPMTPRASTFQPRRLNLLVPSINAEHYFGGIHTAFQMFEAMAPHYAASRVILTDAPPNEAALLRFSRYSHVAAGEENAASTQLVAFSDRYGKTIPVSSSDDWMATAWWTAFAAQRLAAWQAKEYGDEGRVAYMIQDFEPGFYPWSSQSALALATYRPQRDVGIFNTSLLADYFDGQGLNYSRRFVFEPTINDGLRGALEAARSDPRPRKKRIVVYARPSTPRNAFALVCEGLRAWAWSDPRALEWEIVAPGELTGELDLGPLKLRSLGKLSITDYADLLATSALGVSLMVSPHPSYPPLEMAAMGMSVVTNRFANKDLASYSANVVSVADMNPETIGEALRATCGEWLDRDMHPQAIMSADHPYLRGQVFDEVGRQAARAMGMAV